MILYRLLRILCTYQKIGKVTKSKTVFQTDDSLFKMLYLAVSDIAKKRTGQRQDGRSLRLKVEIYFEHRMYE